MNETSLEISRPKTAWKQGVSAHRWRAAVAFAAMGMAFTAVTGAEKDAGLSTIVSRIGMPSSTYDDYRALDRDRCAALPLLVDALNALPPVPPGKVGGAIGRADDELTDRTSGLLRGLRMLTNHDEFGPISRRGYARLPRYRVKPGGDGMIQSDSLVSGLRGGRSRYFGYWMSRGTSFYAPIGTQRAIRAQWTSFIRSFDCRASLPDRRWDATFFNG